MAYAKSLLISTLTVVSFLFGQETWKDNGSFNHNSHLNNMPGQPRNPNGIPPGFNSSIAHPSSFKVAVGGIDFLSDGRMVVAQWLHKSTNEGRIYLVENPSEDPAKMKITEIFKGKVEEILGLRVVDDVIYFSSHDGIFKLNNNGGKYESELIMAPGVPVVQKNGSAAFPRVYSLEYYSGNFYYTVSGYKNFNIPDNDGVVMKASLATKEQEIVGRGVRNANGMGMTKSGEVFFADNQGEWRPANAIYHVPKDKSVHFGYPKASQSDGNTGGAMKHFAPRPPESEVQKPAIQIPYRPGGASLTNMHYLEHTPFAGQFLVGDVTVGVVHRTYMEKVNGQYQGASFQFSSVLEAGIQAFTTGPDGTIYGGALGHSTPGWNVSGRTTGLMKWKMNDKPLRDIQAIRSNRTGFDIVFTEPLAPGAADPKHFWVESYYYQPTINYGGNQLDPKKMKITEIKVAKDRKTVAISLEGLKADRVYRFAFAPSLKFENGTSLWNPNAWYNLNSISQAEPLVPLAVSPRISSQFQPEWRFVNNQLTISLKKNEVYRIKLINIRGETVARAAGSGSDLIRLAVPRQGVYLLEIEGKNKSEVLKLSLFQ